MQTSWRGVFNLLLLTHAKYGNIFLKYESLGGKFHRMPYCVQYVLEENLVQSEIGLL